MIISSVFLLFSVFRKKKGSHLSLVLEDCAGFFFVLLIAILINAGKQTKTPTGAINIGFSIPQEELFIPAEPDFVPELLFEREPRRYWALEDLRPYWRKPEISEHWKEEIKSAVDKIMEGVP